MNEYEKPLKKEIRIKLKAGKYLFRNFNLLKGERKIVKVDNQNVIQMYCDYFTQTREAVWSLVQGLALVKSEE